MFFFYIGVTLTYLTETFSSFHLCVWFRKLSGIQSLQEIVFQGFLPFTEYETRKVHKTNASKS